MTNIIFFRPRPPPTAMQCDPKCSQYQPCISACPIETCDTANERGKDKKYCIDDTCVEGCQLKGCPEGHIYTNETYSECVPKTTCKPVCKEINGITYYEGDVTKRDNCHTCHCSKGKEICVGLPCNDRSILPEHTSQPPVYHDASAKCISGWTPWLNQDMGDANKMIYNGHSDTKINDIEPLPNYYLLKNIIGGSAACNISSMKQIECRTVNTHINPKQTGEDAECSLERGLYCEGKCHDYEIRVLCDCEDHLDVFTTPKVPHIWKTTTQSYMRIVQSTTTASVLINEHCDKNVPHVEYPGDCEKFLHCQPMNDGTYKYAEKTCGPTMLFNPITMICDWPAAVLAIKPTCGHMEIHETTSAKYIEEKDTRCPPGMEFLLFNFLRIFHSKEKLRYF